MIPPPLEINSLAKKEMGDVVAERKGTQSASSSKQVEEHDGNWLEEWEDDEDISWGVLEQDQDHQEEEENANNQFVVTNYCISGRNIAIKQQPQLGIAHQVWHAVCNRQKSSSSSSSSLNPPHCCLNFQSISSVWY